MSRSPSFSVNSVKSEPNLKVDEKALQQWVISFCIIRFDLEQGQLIEECYPPGSLTQSEELDVSFSSFPDSVSQSHNRSSIHDSIFFFRFRRQQKSQVSSEIVGADRALTSKKPLGAEFSKTSARSNNVIEPRYLYGFVFNRQRHDERLKRGGEQKSVVILSHSPFLGVFRPLLQIVGPLYFDIGEKALHYVASYVSTWPAPVPGELMELPIGNATLKVHLPPAHCLPLDCGVFIEELASSVAPFLQPSNHSVPNGLFHDSDLFSIFRGLLMQMWKLWELLLIGEPLLIIAPTPPQCCEAVAGLVSLVAPLLCSIDFRPYFTIHDAEFAYLNSLPEGATFPPMVLGVTNLFFLKALRNIPHIVSVGSPTPNSNRVSLGNISSPGLNLRKFTPLNFLNAVKMRRDGPLCLMTEHKEAIWTTYNAITKPDTSILNRLIDAGMSPRVEESMSVVNNEILRRHFLELTTNFLAPFAPYFTVTTPSEGSSPFIDPPPLPSFNVEEFLSVLSARGPGKFLLKRMTSNWLDLYRRFMKGHNFIPWFQRKRAVAEHEQYRLWRQARVKVDIKQIISPMSELEIVDTYNAIEKNFIREMQHSRSTDAESGATCQKLKKDLQAVFSVLSHDIQHLMLMNPERAALLQENHEGS
ncbi:hypothetical protein DM860_007760 [Cuscuta australis]|uniref:UDENN domain-containing protein n=1 Tax=Cuscuta australis TaxID=267555 RepID=A0A328DXX4_9ASTE|nr:hypothetical protein DM860_007760 [Cuscuta australis]